MAKIVTIAKEYGKKLKMKERDIKGFIENERRLYPGGRHYSHKTKLTDKKVREDILFYHRATPYRW